ncbi:MAG: hypothetical protein EOS18_32620 [Mesorhizobium sp.]|nr:MAG: hypothetical protein EOS18_32620 [Mesorhizobium sp.]
MRDVSTRYLAQDGRTRARCRAAKADRPRLALEWSRCIPVGCGPGTFGLRCATGRRLDDQIRQRSRVHRSQSVDLTIIRNETGWTVNGQRQPAVQSMVDLDYSFTPATNLQQIRRMNLKVGDKADFPVAWLVAGVSSLVVLPQTYHRVSETEYIYEAPTVPYRATLLIPEAGFAEDYPDGWVFETGNAGRAV